MFVGHIGVGLALKKVEPKLNLGALIFASLALDVLLGIFILSDLEKVVVPENYSQLHYLNFVFPYSHSLLAAAVCSFIAFGVTYIIWKGENRLRLNASFTISGAVFIHWICDWIEHPPQLSLTGMDSSLLGLGLWNNLEMALTFEVMLVVIGMMIYLGTAKEIDRKGRSGIMGLVAILTVIAVVGQATVTQAPEPNAVAGSIIVQALVVAGLTAWIDRSRHVLHLKTLQRTNR